MAELATGVVLVTCRIDGKPWGLTVSACCSVSLSPPLLLVSLSNQTASVDAINADGNFGVSILGEKLLDVARFGSAKGQPKFVDEFCSYETSSDGSATPAVADAMAHVDCLVEQTLPAGDHVIYIGRVKKVLQARGDRPLVYYSRGYHRLGDSTMLGTGPVPDETVDSLLHDYPLPRTFARHDTASRRSGLAAFRSMTTP